MSLFFKSFKLAVPAVFSLVILGCNAASDLTDIADVAVNPPERESIDRSKLGVQNFFTSKAAFGSVEEQFRDIKQNLGIRYVRILVPWIESRQSSKDEPYNFDSADEILNSIPVGVDVLVVLAHTPDWFRNPANQTNANPRQAWVDQFLTPVINRYKSNPRIIGWEVFNEPDIVTVPSDVVLELTDPVNYVELMKLANAAIKSISPGKLAVMAATVSIQQNFPNNFNYNKALKDGGIGEFTDVWNIHYYGKQFEKVVAAGGIADFLNGTGKEIWITESGQQGPNEQLEYVETVWPFLTEKIPGISRIYYYEYSSNAPITQSFGLRSTDQSFPVSDFYVDLIGKDN